MKKNYNLEKKLAQYRNMITKLEQEKGVKEKMMDVVNEGRRSA